MNKAVLIGIKLIVSIFILAFVGATKIMGIPIVIGNLIGIAVLIAVWRYKPETVDNSDKHELDKK